MWLRNWFGWSPYLRASVSQEKYRLDSFLFCILALFCDPAVSVLSWGICIRGCFSIPPQAMSAWLYTWGCACLHCQVAGKKQYPMAAGCWFTFPTQEYVPGSCADPSAGTPARWYWAHTCQVIPGSYPQACWHGCCTHSWKSSDISCEVKVLSSNLNHAASVGGERRRKRERGNCFINLFLFYFHVFKY